MGAFMALIPIAAVLLTALSRVHAIRGTETRGTTEREVRLTFVERMRYHRISLYALAAVLAIGTLGGVTHSLVALMAIVAMYAIIGIPVRVKTTSTGVGINRLFFRSWSEFSGYDAGKHSIRLSGKTGFGHLDLPVMAIHQAPLLAKIAMRMPKTSAARTTSRWLQAGVVATFAAVALTLAAPHAFADDPPAPPAIDASGATVGTPEDLAGIGVGGGSLAVLDKDGKLDAKATAAMFEKAKKDEPYAYNLSAYVNQNRLAVNFVWVLFCGYLVMFMQAGFAMVETGFARAKHALHVMMTNFMVYGLGMLAYWATGFALQFGGVGLTGPTNLGAGLLALDQEFTVSIAGINWGLFGMKGFFLNSGVFDVGIITLFLFQMVFMDTTATILTGTMAERWQWRGFVIWSILVGGFIYPIFGNWAWGGGWLFQLKDSSIGRPYVDFAGSGVVHAVGGWAGLVGAWILGPRLGKYRADGTPIPMPGHNLIMAAVGTFILAFGWFGFNPGSTLGASGSGNLRIGIIAVVTMLAGASASVAAMVYARATIGKYDAGYMINGLLGGLVAITAPSGYVNPISAVIIGVIAGLLTCMAIGFCERTLKIDDPVGAWSVHGVNGVWGMLAVGLFADGSAPDFLVVGYPIRGLFYGDAAQLMAQIVGVITVIVWSGGTSFVLFKILMAMGVLRSKPEDEMAGLDIPEMGGHAYPIQDMPGGGVLTVGGLTSTTR